jgi:hypothetical protein
MTTVTTLQDIINSHYQPMEPGFRPFTGVGHRLGSMYTHHPTHVKPTVVHHQAHVKAPMAYEPTRLDFVQPTVMLEPRVRIPINQNTRGTTIQQQARDNAIVDMVLNTIRFNKRFLEEIC